MGSHRTTSRRLQALSGMCVMVLVLLVFISHVIMAVQGSVLYVSYTNLTLPTIREV